MKKRSLITILLLALILSSCSQELAPVTAEALPSEMTATEEKTVKTKEENNLTPEEKAVLDARREIACDYMNQMASLLWRSDEEVVYTIKSGVSPDEVKNGSGSPVKLTIQKGRLYRGLPYTYGGNGIPSFSEYFSATDDKGVPTVSGLTWPILSGGFQESRLGNDCSTAVMQAWGQAGASSIALTNTKNMCASYGYLPVGDYEVSATELSATKEDCKRNGQGVMFAAYAALQKGDAVVRRNSGTGHAMLVTSVHAVPLGGGFDATESYITVTHQTRGKYSADAKYYSKEHGEEIYYWYGIDDKFTFAKLFADGYLPITCKELIDPAPLPERKVAATEVEEKAENLLSGNISSTRMMEKICAEILDDKGTVLQSSAAYPTRRVKLEYPLSDLAENGSGTLDPAALPKGNYRFRITVLLNDGTTHTAREFAFSS